MAQAPRPAAGGGLVRRVTVRSLLGAVVAVAVGVSLLGPMPGTAQQAAASVAHTGSGSAAGGGLVLAQTGGFGDVPGDAYYSDAVSTLAAQGVFVGTECDVGFCPAEPIDRKTMAVWTVRVLDGQDPPVISRTRFNDVDAVGFYGPFIERMAELGVTRGCGDGSGFCPDRTVTRAQMAVFLSRAYSLPAGPDPGFADVPDDAWYAAEVARLAASGITVGCGDGTNFCPSRATTRAQMATFLWRARVRDAPPSLSVSQSEVLVIEEAAGESGFDDPHQIELPDPVEALATRAWLQAEGEAIVGLVARIAEFWTEDEPDCAVIAADLDLLGTPSQLRAAAIMTPDPVTAELLSAVHFGATAILRSCSDSLDSAEHAWQWSLAYQRLVQLGIASACQGTGCTSSADTGSNGPEPHTDLSMQELHQPVLFAPAPSIFAPGSVDSQQSAHPTPAAASATVAAGAQSGSAPHGSISWQSAGDSYSAGQGLREREGACARSPLAYGPTAANLLRDRGWDIGPVTFTACSGAVTEQYFNNWSVPWGPSVPETIAICGGHLLCITALPRGTHTINSQWQQGLDQGGPERVDVIVMSFGGNDIGFPDVLSDCVIFPDSWQDVAFASGCDISEEELIARIDNLIDPPAECPGSPRYTRTDNSRYECDLDLGTHRGSMVDLYESIVTDRLSPSGRLFVVGYPRLFAPLEEWPGWVKTSCNEIWRGDTEKLGRLAEHFDVKLKHAVDIANSRLGGADRIHYLDLLALYRNNKAELCGTNQDWLDGLRGPPDTTCCSFHPNASGHAETAQKLADLIAEEWPAATCPQTGGAGVVAYGAVDGVWIADADTGNSCRAAAGGSHPTWSPDGTKLAFADAALRAIRVFDLPTRRATTMVPYSSAPHSGLEAVYDLAWSPSGDEIAFTALSGGDYNVWIARTDGTGTWRNLTASDSTGEYQPAWSPDGTQIAYASDRDGDNDIYITNADGTGTPRNITDGTRTVSRRGNSQRALGDGNETDPAWANDGRIAFASDRASTSGNSDIYLTSDPYNTWDAVTDNPDHDQTQPAWSSDSSRLAFAHKTSSTGTYDIWTTDFSLEFEPFALTRDSETHPAWSQSTPEPAIEDSAAPTTTSPGSGTTGAQTVSRIAYVSSSDGDSDIWVMDADGTNKQQLTTSSADEYSPIWSPDGTRIAYVSSSGIWVMDADGTNKQQLTTSSADGYPPIWSPDGTRIAYVSRSSIWVMDADGTNKQQLTTSSAHESYPTWSPDGTRIAYRSQTYSGRDRNIWVMDADGTNKQQLTTSSAHEIQPTWSPDGTRIYYVSWKSSASNRYSIWAMMADGTNQQRLTRTFPRFANFVLSPRGTHIAYVRHFRGTSFAGYLWIVDLDGTSTREIATNVGGSATWSPDGRSIAYSGSRLGSRENWGIWVVNADGSNRQRLSDSGVYPAWSPAVSAN